MASLTYAVIGPGAIGGYYGGRLQQSGKQVHFLARSDYLHIKDHGLRIESKDGDFTLPEVNVYRDPSEMPQCDVVLVCVKATQNSVLQGILPQLAGNHGSVVLLQNGLGAEEQVAQWVDPEQVHGGLCFVCSTKVGPGHIRHIDYGAIRFARYTPDGDAGGVSGTMERIGGDFSSAGIAPVELAEHLRLARWRKLVWNIPFNGLCALLRTDTRSLVDDKQTLALVRTIMREVVAGARECGLPLEQDVVEAMIENTRKMAPYSPSMRIDLERNHPMEVEAIFGIPLKRLGEAGFRAPHIDMLYRCLCFLGMPAAR